MGTNGEYDIFRPLTLTQSHFNTRIKTFDDFVKVACFSKPIFNPDGFESIEKNPRISYEKDMSNGARSDSINRAKNKVFEMAFANDFTYFITLTLDKEKINRTEIKEIYKALKNWLSNMVSRRNMSYVICPEYHKDGKAIHFHGLCKGDLDLTDSGTLYVKGRKKPVKRDTAERLGVTGQPVYNLDNWKYGFSTVVELDKNKEGVAVYITKYITKAQDKIFGKFYFSGGDLTRQVPTDYCNTAYTEFDGEEKTVLEGVLAVKYKSTISL